MSDKPTPAAVVPPVALNPVSPARPLPVKGKARVWFKDPATGERKERVGK